MKRFFVILFMFISLGFLVFQCENPDEEDAPELPPLESFLMDMDYFDTTDTKSTLLDTVSFQNWSYAAGQVLFWNVAVIITSAIPIAAFVESFNHSPEYLGNKKWEWAYVVLSNNTSYTARLTGEILESDSVEWKMSISKDIPFPYTDVLWYEGRAHLDRTGGWWILRKEPYAPKDFIKITWERTSNTTGDLKYTNIIPGNPGNGGYISFSRVEEDANGYDSYYTIYGPQEDATINIEWHHMNKNGRVKKHNKTEWSCWDENLYDTDDCP